MKAPSPLLGFNNNVRHKGRVFHIQTEDSGIRHPHVITHLFADGGRILKTTKTSYAEHIGQDRLTETVRAMMQEQHKAMFIALRDGQFDYLFDEGGSGPSSTKAPSRLQAPPPADSTPALPDPPPPPPEPEPEPPPVTVASPKPEPEAEAAPLVEPEAIEPEPPSPPPAPIVVVPPPLEDEVRPSPPRAKPPPLPPRPAIPRPGAAGEKPRPVAQFAPTEPVQRAAVSPSHDGVPSRGPSVEPAQAVAESRRDNGDLAAKPRRGTQRPTLDVDPGAIHGVPAGNEASIDLDLDALERAAAEAQTPFFQQIQDLPPPPAAVLGSKRGSTGGYSVRSPAPPPAGAAAQDGGYAARPQGPSRPPEPLPAPKPREAPKPAVPSPGRYAPSRPASIFATTRPQEGASIFGEDLISEKSLDEVILSYLAEDLDGPAEKK